MKRKTFNHVSDLQAAYRSRVARDTKNGHPPTMTVVEFEVAWLSEPRKLAQRHNGNSGYVMRRIDFTKPLSADNYEIVLRSESKRKLKEISSIVNAGKPKTIRQRKNISRSMKGKNKGNSNAAGRNSAKGRSNKKAAALARWANYREQKKSSE